MRLPLAARLARRELRGGIVGFRVFLACLALGVAAIAAVGTLRGGLQDGLVREGATLLGGDAEIALTYRFADAQERAWLADTGAAVSEIVDFRSMAVAGGNGGGTGGGARRGLTQVKAVDAAYPLYGTVELDPPMPLAAALDGGDGLPGIVMEAALARRLDVAPGDTVRLGQNAFRLAATIRREPDSTGGFTLGPRSIVRRAALEGSGLLGEGTLFETRYRLRFDAGTGAGADLDARRAAAEAAFGGGGMRWRDRREPSPFLSRAVDRLSTFLVLVGLASLTVGGVGISTAVKNYLDEKVGVIATLKSLGARSGLIVATYFLQIGALALIGIAIGLALGALLPVLLAPLIQSLSPIPVALGLAPGALGQAAVYGLLTAIAFTLWPLARTESVRAAVLFRDADLGVRARPRAAWVLATAAVVALLVGTAVAFTGQARLTLWAAAALIVAFAALVLAGRAVRWLARVAAGRAVLRRRFTLRNALAAVGGPRGDAVAVVLSLGLGLSVLSAIGQIDANLRAAITADLPEIAPSYFVVDIQPDQMEGFNARLAGDPAVHKVEAAPMLRGVITEINGRPAREVAGDHWVISGDRGVTYSARQPAGTKLTAGRWWPEDYTGEPQISFAAEEAAEIGLKLGDRMTVNILGRDVTGTITSFREVDFSGAGMGFVLAMNPSALAGAPHINIATIYADADAEEQIVDDLTGQFPNITAIRVRDAIDRVVEVISGVAAAIKLGALGALSTGVVVLIGAAAAGERSRTYEAAVLKTLGAERRSILANFSIRAAVLGAAAGSVAVLAGAAASWAVMTRIMELEFRFAPGSAVLIVSGGVLLTILSGLVFSLRSLAVRPSGILRARE